MRVNSYHRSRVAVLFWFCLLSRAHGWGLPRPIRVLRSPRASQTRSQPRPPASCRLFQTEGDEIATKATTNATFVGIGGKNGTSYDVNLLKHNIVTETVHKFKKEIWDLLSNVDTDYELVEEKLAALIQTRAVSTTTDSNLLDGRWTFVFGSPHSASSLLDSNRFDIAQNSPSRSTQVGATVTDGMLSSSFREFYLEDVEDDEEAYIQDCTDYVGGLMRRTRRYEVTSLSRTTLEVALSQVKWRMLGCQTSTQKTKGPPMGLRILYLDSDLCVVTRDEDMTKSPFYVYTKSTAWVGYKERVKRHLSLRLSRLRSFLWGVLQVRKRIFKALVSRLPKLPHRKQTPTMTSPVLLQETLPSGTRMNFVTLGDLGEEDNAWEGEQDPFVHLSADERQEYLKTLRVKDLVKAAVQQEKRSANNRANKQKKQLERQMPFKKPASN